MSDQHNFVLCARNEAKLHGTVTAHGEATGGEAANLVNYTRPELSWIPESAAPHATSILCRYSGEYATRALCLAAGRLPTAGTSVRVCRGTSLRPTLVHWNTETAATNATGSLDRSVDPRDAVAGTYVTASTPGSDWSVTLDFADSEFEWSNDRDQHLVLVAGSSVASADCTMLVELLDGTSWISLATLDLAAVASAASRYSFRLMQNDIDSPAAVRISGTFVTTGDARLHGLAFVGPVDPANDVLRLAGDFVSSMNTTGTVENAFQNPLDTKVVAEDAIVIGSGSTGDGFLAALETDTRDMTAATLKFSWKLGAATSTTVTAKLFHAGVEIATIGTYNDSTTAVHNESTSVTVGSLPDADAVDLQLEFTRSVGSAAIRITGVAFYPTYAAAAETRTYDSGWSTIAGGTSPYIAGGLAVDNVGRPIDVTIARDFRDGSNNSVEVLARDTFVDLDITRDPDDADVVLAVADQPAREISFRYFFEGPGLANMSLQRGISVDFPDASEIDETLGAWPITVVRRIYRTLAFEIGSLPADIGPEEVGSLLYRVGQTEPLLFIVLPTIQSVSNLFSMFGLVARDASISHAFARVVDAKIRMREY